MANVRETEGGFVSRSIPRDRFSTDRQFYEAAKHAKYPITLLRSSEQRPKNLIVQTDFSTFNILEALRERVASSEIAQVIELVDTGNLDDLVSLMQHAFTIHPRSSSTLPLQLIESAYVRAVRRVTMTTTIDIEHIRIYNRLQRHHRKQARPKDLWKRLTSEIKQEIKADDRLKPKSLSQSSS